jgi:hypothetical protein
MFTKKTAMGSAYTLIKNIQEWPPEKIKREYGKSSNVRDEIKNILKGVANRSIPLDTAISMIREFDEAMEEKLELRYRTNGCAGYL